MVVQLAKRLAQLMRQLRQVLLAADTGHQQPRTHGMVERDDFGAGRDPADPTLISGFHLKLSFR
jgi:hypothetical protein